MPPRSKVKSLPAAVKTWLDKALADNHFSEYESLSQALEARGFAISRSALQRYGQEFENRLSRLKLSSEQAKSVVAASPDDEGAVAEALTRLVQERLFDLLMAGDGKLDVAKVAKAVAELGRANVTQQKWKAEYRERVRQQFAQEAAEAISEELRGADGMSEALESQPRRRARSTWPKKCNYTAWSCRRTWATRSRPTSRYFSVTSNAGSRTPARS